MVKGKSICKVLKTIRKQVADANDIKYEPRECHHQGECRGTCPACEAEVKYIERQLDIRRLLGKAVAVVGISAGLAVLTSCKSKITTVSEEQSSLTNGKDIIKPSEHFDGDVEYRSPVDTVIIEKDPSTIKKRTAEFVAQEIGDTINEPSPSKVGEITCTMADLYHMPSFPGGPTKLMEFIKENLHYPDERDICAQGRVFVTFVVETDGSITDVEVIRSIDPLLDSEAVRVVKSMPKWIPGTQDGKPVKVKYTIPFTFRPNENTIDRHMPTSAGN